MEALAAQRVEAIKHELRDPRIEREALGLAQEMARLGSSGMCDLPAGTATEWHAAIWAAVDEGYLELIRGSRVRRVPLKFDDIETEQPAAKPAKDKKDCQLGFAFED
ncbi:MAG: hypothetical protein ACTHOU_22370 [Aureliella sp.]